MKDRHVKIASYFGAIGLSASVYIVDYLLHDRPQWMLAVATSVAVFCFSVSAWYYLPVLQKNWKTWRLTSFRRHQYHFGCDVRVIRSIRQQLAAVYDDATNYQRHSTDMNDRLAKLEQQKGVLLDSPFAISFNDFMRDARALIGCKEANKSGLSSLLLHEVNLFKSSISQHYDVLKQALGNDISHRS